MIRVGLGQPKQNNTKQNKTKLQEAEQVLVGVRTVKMGPPRTAEF